MERQSATSSAAKSPTIAASAHTSATASEPDPQAAGSAIGELPMRSRPLRKSAQVGLAWHYCRWQFSLRLCVDTMSVKACADAQLARTLQMRSDRGWRVAKPRKSSWDPATDLPPSVDHRPERDDRAPVMKTAKRRKSTETASKAYSSPAVVEPKPPAASSSASRLPTATVVWFLASRYSYALI